MRPHYGLLTFFGFAFGPVVGFLTGLIGNIVGDSPDRLGRVHLVALEPGERRRRPAGRPDRRLVRRP